MSTERPAIMWSRPPRDNVTVSEPDPPVDVLVTVCWTDGHVEQVEAEATAWAWPGLVIPFVHCRFIDPRAGVPARGWVRVTDIRRR